MVVIKGGREGITRFGLGGEVGAFDVVAEPRTISLLTTVLNMAQTGLSIAPRHVTTTPRSITGPHRAMSSARESGAH